MKKNLVTLRPELKDIDERFNHFNDNRPKVHYPQTKLVAMKLSLALQATRTKHGRPLGFGLEFGISPWRKHLHATGRSSVSSLYQGFIFLARSREEIAIGVQCFRFSRDTTMALSECDLPYILFTGDSDSRRPDI